MKWAIYVRTNVVDDKALISQERVIRRALGKKEQIYAVYKDNGRSGSNLNRSGLRQLREDARKGRFHGVAVYDTSRLSRRLWDCMVLIEEFERNGIVLKSATQDLSSPMGKLAARLVAVVADYNREMQASRREAAFED